MAALTAEQAASDRGNANRTGGFSRWAIAAALLGILVLLASMLAGLGSRWGWWHFGTGFTILRWAGRASVVLIAVSLIAIVITRPGSAKRGFLLASFGLFAALLLIGNGISLQRKARSVPPIHDISTDTENPPQFVAVLPLRADAPNPSEYGGPEIAAQQKAAYPDVQPVILNVPPDQAFNRALATAEEMGWTLVAIEPAEGRIEATARTFWFGFRDDVVIRLTPADGGTRVDVRSVSRVGRSDVGANAARIRKYFEELQD